MRDSPQNYNIFDRGWHSYFIDTAASYYDYPIVATFPQGYPVVIEAVKETKGISVIGGPYTQINLVLSMEHPSKKNKRIKVYSNLDYVEPFRDLKGHKILNSWH